jgi:hypothetical protein
MSDPFSQYVALLDGIEQIPVAARQSPTLSTEQRADAMARVVELVRDRVLPQSRRDKAGLEALLGDRVDGPARTPDHDAITAPVDDLGRADPRDGVRVQQLLYRLYAAIASHFGEAELLVAATVVEEPPILGVSVPTSARSANDALGRESAGPSRWFG